MAARLAAIAVAALCLSLGATLPTPSPPPQPQTLAELSSELAQLGFPGVYDHFENKYGDYHPRNQSSTVSCPIACDILSFVFNPNQTVGQGNPEYGISTQYWSQQQNETMPQCYFTPNNARQVAGTVLVAEFTNCPFAAKSGGHACFAGASNIENGVTIDFKNMNDITLSADKTTTSVGPGNQWIDVYNALSPQNLSVIGGRVSAIGVGGLTLGGGISFFSGLHGWACDNVRNYEVVLAGGRIIDVNYTSYPDLYFALRGGGNNFGLVTRFDLVTFEQGLMWGGMVTWPIAANVSLFESFVQFVHDAPGDPHAALIVNFAYFEGNFFASVDMDYSLPVVNPPIFHHFTSTPYQNLTDTLRITTLPNITNEFQQANPSGLRETYTTATFGVSAELLGKILDIFVEEVAALTAVPSILPALVTQPITTDVISHFSQNGGNALGLADTEGPLLLVNLAIMWEDSTFDDLVISTTNSIIHRSVRQAREMGLHNKFIYQNYASLVQDVFDGYGQENKHKLISIAKKYDPLGVFQRLEPGYFKLYKPGGSAGTYSRGFTKT